MRGHMGLFRGAANYPYVCARVRARVPFLLKREEYLKLASMSLGEVSEFIGQSQYKAEVESLAPEHAGADLIERATYANMAKTYDDVVSYCQGEARDIVWRYARRLEMLNLKTVLRGVFHHAPVEEIVNETIPCGRFGREEAARLGALGTIPELIQALEGTEYYPPLSRAYQECGCETLMPLENELDRAYYAYLLDGLDRSQKASALFFSYVQSEIDIVNLKSLLKLLRERIAGQAVPNAERFALAGGREISTERFSQLAAMPLQDFVEALRSLSFHEEIARGVEALESSGDVGHLIRDCERHLMGRSRRFSHLYPLSILPIVHYLMAKHREVENIRIISRGKEAGLDRDDIMELMVI